MLGKRKKYTTNSFKYQWHILCSSFSLELCFECDHLLSNTSLKIHVWCWLFTTRMAFSAWGRCSCCKPHPSRPQTTLTVGLGPLRRTEWPGPTPEEFQMARPSPQFLKAGECPGPTLQEKNKRVLDQATKSHQSPSLLQDQAT